MTTFNGSGIDGKNAQVDPTGLTNVTSSTVQGAIAELDTAIGGGGGGEDLAATLIFGNVTGGTNIVVSAGDEIQGLDGGGIGVDGENLVIRPGAGGPGVQATGTFTIVAAPLVVADRVNLTGFSRSLIGVAGVRVPGSDTFSVDPVTTAGVAIEIAAAMNDSNFLTGSATNGGGVTAVAVGSTVVMTAQFDGVGGNSRQYFSQTTPIGQITPFLGGPAAFMAGGLDAGLTGALIAGSGGAPRGDGAIDLQTIRLADNEVAAPPHSILLGGVRNRLAESSTPGENEGTAIFGGHDNIIAGEYSKRSMIFGGYANTIGVGSTYDYGCYGAKIIGGGSNQILDYSGMSTIIGGGWNNRIGGGPSPGYFHTGALVSGSGNYVEGNLPWGGGYYSITVGRNNRNKGGQNSGIIGRFCEVWNQNSFAGGNVVVNKGYGTFMWGQNHQTHDQAHYNSYSDFASAFGAGAYIYCRGQAVWSNQNSGSFATGSTQRSSYGLFRRTTTASTLTLSLDGSNPTAQRDRLRIMPGRCYAFRISVSAYQDGGAAGTIGDSATWEITGAIKRTDVSLTALVGLSGAGTPLFADAAAAGWTVAVFADNTNNAFSVQVTGELNKNITWHAAVHTSESGRNP
jgi:hypothetical protein